MAVLANDISRHLAAHEAARDLRIDVAEQEFREAGVVLNHPKDVGPALSFVEQLHGPSRGRAGTGHRAADVDPVHHYAKEGSDLAFSVVQPNGRVHHDIVQVLPERARVVRYHHVAVAQLVSPVELESIADCSPQCVGHKDGQAATRLRDQPTLWIDDADGVVLVLVDER